jgi:predicted O-linked N-acetylglucosamine transferase (SPINDLY family)
MRIESPSPQAHALFQQALESQRSGDSVKAQAFYAQALKLDPTHVEALHMAGILMAQQDNFPAAVALMGEAVRLKPDHAHAHNNLGNVLQRVNELEAALHHYQLAITLNPHFSDAFNNQGVVLNELHRHEEAIVSLQAALALKPQYPAALSNLGLALEATEQFNEALAYHDQAIALAPQHPECHYNRGQVLLKLKRWEEARVSNCQAIQLQPDFALAQHNLGLSQEALDQLESALESFELAITQDANYAPAYFGKGRVLQASKQYKAALACFDTAIRLSPKLADVESHRGLVLQMLNQFDAALKSYDHALHLKPDQPEILNNRAAVLQVLKRFPEALNSVKRAITLKPDYALAYIALGNLHAELKQLEAALQSYTQALEINPNHDFLQGIRLHLQMQLCDWKNWGKQANELVAKINAGIKVCPPFALLAISSDPATHHQAAALWMNGLLAGLPTAPDVLPHVARTKIRLGYFSADFHDHATAYLIAELFELHDKSKFELVAFSFGPKKYDGMQRRLMKSFDHFIELQDTTDQEIAILARSMDIDIAIDLKGYTQNSRPGIFALRAAPVQVNYLGFPGSMGADFMDYLVADHTLIPPQSQLHYSEKIAYLPHSYQVNDAKRQISDRVFTREEVGLPPTGFVFCCFNNNYKITPDTFDGWMRILQAVPNSVLWLLADNPTAAQNLSKEAELRGVSAKRLVFAPRMGLAEHLARHRLADLFIDTLPCNAHTTASDALWAGLPVLTSMGEGFASRVAASLLQAVGLPELITESQPAYEALAIELANHPEQLAVIKLKLERNRLTTPLFDTTSYARHLEALYEQMYVPSSVGMAVEQILAV